MGRKKQRTAMSRGHTVTMILAVLKDGATHGYEIAREVERRSENRLSCRDGIMYPLLHALEDDGLISSEWSGQPGERRKRVYTVTEVGLAELDRQIQAWQSYAKALDNVLGAARGSAYQRLILAFRQP